MVNNVPIDERIKNIDAAAVQYTQDAVSSWRAFDINCKLLCEALDEKGGTVCLSNGQAEALTNIADKAANKEMRAKLLEILARYGGKAGLDLLVVEYYSAKDALVKKLTGEALMRVFSERLGKEQDEKKRELLERDIERIKSELRRAASNNRPPLRGSSKTHDALSEGETEWESRERQWRETEVKKRNELKQGNKTNGQQTKPAGKKQAPARK